MQLLKYEGSVLSGGIYLTDTIGFPEDDDFKFRKDLQIGPLPPYKSLQMRTEISEITFG